MKKFLKSLYHFLGGIHFAILLIAAASIFVVSGTFIESKTNSHLFAAHWIYDHFLFQALLSLFFINILFSALRRWPFKRKHAPFLITHLGLLMVIGGTMIKNRYGLQGNMTVLEGSGNHTVSLPHSFALAIETPQTKSIVPLKTLEPSIYYPFHFPELKCKIIACASHVNEKMETWIKGTHAYIAGAPPLKVIDWSPEQTLPTGEVHNIENVPLKIIPLKTSHPKEAIHQLYLQDLHISSGDFKKELALDDEISILHLSSDKEKIHIPLQGEDALLNKTDFYPPSLTVDLKRDYPTLILLEDKEGQTSLWTFDSHGRIHEEKFNSSQLKNLFSYDYGFKGYGIQASLPLPSFSHSREDKENADLFDLKMQLDHALLSNPLLAPPLQLFKEACERTQIPFTKTFVQFLSDWNKSHSFFFLDSSTFEYLLNQFDWTALSPEDQQGCLWALHLLDQIETSLKEGEDILSILEKNHWPFLEEIKKEGASLHLLGQHIGAMSPYLPSLDFPSNLSPADQGKMLSAFFLLYGIHYRSLIPYREGNRESFNRLASYWETTKNRKFKTHLLLETFLTPQLIPEDPPLKYEDQKPGIVVEFTEGEDKEIAALPYDAAESGLKRPILNGKYLVRFQTNQIEIPHHIRLREARQIPYPQSAQIFSYECDLLVSEDRKNPTAQTLSMNHVHETNDGYRFYLAGVGTSADGQLKRIQLAVNYDPVKYVLTYPGALLVFIGIVLLLWILPYKKS